jgi:hypothetical protein
MNDGDKRWLLQWRRYSVDVLITAATLAVAAAALGTTADILYLLVIFGAVLGLALLLEPSGSLQTPMDAHPMKLVLAQLRNDPQPVPRLGSARLDAKSLS